jgi:hypothetical protein
MSKLAIATAARPFKLSGAPIGHNDIRNNLARRPPLGRLALPLLLDPKRNGREGDHNGQPAKAVPESATDHIVSTVGHSR